jgi:hypothetical protein
MPYAGRDVPGQTRQLVAYLAGVAAQPLPRDVQERTQLHLLETLGAIISGAKLRDTGQRAIGYVRPEGSASDATVIGGGLTAGLPSKVSGAQAMTRPSGMVHR